MFRPDALFHTLQRLAPAGRYLVAYSGGADSHVLLHALAGLRPRLGGVELVAVHVDHALSPFSVEWSRHCQLVCAGLNVRCAVSRVDARPEPDESPEEAARRARYAVFESMLRSGDVLLVAHQQDDQAETMLLQLLRGAGPRGLSAMPFVAPLGAGRLARPLLEHAREELLAYARAHQLQWIDDPSNADTRFDRNYLRVEILPRLKQRWPAAAKTLARSARLCAEAAELLNELGALDRPEPHDETTSSFLKGEALSIAHLQRLSPPRRRNLLRLWLHELDLPTPHETHVERINEMINAAEDANPVVTWPGAEVRRYRGMMHASAPLPPMDPDQELKWETTTRLSIAGVGELSACPATGKGVRASACKLPVTVRFRRGGERLRPRGRKETHTLKHLFQDAGVPPWMRDRVPLIYVGDDLVCVAGYWVAEVWSARDGEDGIVIEFGAAC